MGTRLGTVHPRSMGSFKECLALHLGWCLGVLVCRHVVEQTPGALLPLLLHAFCSVGCSLRKTRLCISAQSSCFIQPWLLLPFLVQDALTRERRVEASSSSLLNPDIIITSSDSYQDCTPTKEELRQEREDLSSRNVGTQQPPEGKKALQLE